MTLWGPTMGDSRNRDMGGVPGNGYLMEINSGADGEGKALYDIEVDYEVLIDPAIKEQIRDILESYAREHDEKDIIFYEERDKGHGYSEDEDRLDLGGIALPVAKFYSEKENKRVKLLYAIAELGDVREVPLLQGMLDQEDNESISGLIKEIILGFLSERSLNEIQERGLSEVGHLGEHYVYNYLFQAVDTESQLLLLDEVHKIGGMEERNFLSTLALHPDERIREKVRYINDRSAQQESWLLREEGSAHKTTVPKDKTVFDPENEILHIDFELDISKIEGREIDSGERRNLLHRSFRSSLLKRSIRWWIDKLKKVSKMYR